jgi:hypothetical protein
VGADKFPAPGVMDRREPESRGQIVRRLDTLLKELRKERENYSSKPDWLLCTGELERLRDEVRYCFLDAGLPAQNALQEINAIDFTKFNALDDQSHKAQYDSIDSRLPLLDGDSERQCIRNLDRLIELVETVRKEETSLMTPNIMPAVAPSSPLTAEKTSVPIRGLDTLSLQTPEKTSTPMRDLAALLKLRSLRQSEAAEALDITPRAIRYLVKNRKLTKSGRGRITCDQKFVEQYHLRHSPTKK